MQTVTSSYARTYHRTVFAILGHAILDKGIAVDYLDGAKSNFLPCGSFSMPDPQKAHPQDEALLQLVGDPLFRRLLDSLSSSIIITDLSGSILYFSQKAYEMYMLDPADGAEGRRIDDLFLSGREGTLEVLESRKHNQINSVFFNGVEGVARRYPIVDDAGMLIGCLSEALTTTRDSRLDDLLNSFMRLKARAASEKSRESMYSFESMIGSSRCMADLKDMGMRFARRRDPVLLMGESGTGKELMAQAIHRASDRGAGPFISINCAALPGDLVESELFGYVEGSFTGSLKGGRKGLFESAEGGTIFLDEIGELHLSVQTKLLRVLETREVQKIGQRGYAHADFRLIAATNSDLPEMVRNGRFREDLYYRINILELRLPPLREHLDDLPLLVAHLMQGICGPQKAMGLRFSPEVVEMFMRYAWPGNVRELKNVLAYAYCRMGDGERIVTPEYLPARLLEGAGPASSRELHMVRPLRTVKESIDRDSISRALRLSKNNKSMAARMLGISRNTLYLKLKALGLDLTGK